MSSPIRIPTALGAALLATGAFAAAGCGSSESRSAHSEPATTTGNTRTTAPAETTPATTTPANTVTTTTPTTPATTTPSPTPTAPPPRTETGPSFVPTPPPGGAMGAAVATVRRLGYVVSNTSTYGPNYTLHVLVGVRQGSADGYMQRAFFFLGDRYLGTDARDPSAQISVVAQDDTAATIRYALYRPGDPNCCSTGGHRDVQFALDNGRLAALGEIPSASASASLSRR